MAIQLPYSLQTYVGMVYNNGRPTDRNFPSQIVDLGNLNSEKRRSFSKIFQFKRDPIAKALSTSDIQSFQDWQKYEPSGVLVEKAQEYLRHPEAFGMCNSAECQDGKRKYLAANYSALSADVTKDDLKRYMKTRTRFDLEQAAAVVISALVNYRRIEDAAKLVGEVGSLLATSCMWIDPVRRLPVSNEMFSPAKLAEKLQQSAASKSQTIPLADSFDELVPLLIRVRTTRCKPDNRCFHIPEWIFKQAEIDPPEHFKQIFQNQDQAPTAPLYEDSIIVSRRHFRHLQKRIYRLYSYWKPNVRLRKSIKKLENDVLYCGSWIDKRVFQADDIGLLCHYFFHFQRRLQRKVVSDMGWTSFLGKGEGSKLYQNNISIKSTFEQLLLEIVESKEEGVIIAMGNQSTLSLIDQTCLLMKEYVDIYGGGNTKNLTFAKGAAGGSGRGPVDEYNLLCDILSQLRQQAKYEGIADVPGRTKKFLAKDIMHWKNAWGDDAFAGEEKAGWEEWLIKRGLMEDEGWALVDGMSEKTLLPLR